MTEGEEEDAAATPLINNWTESPPPTVKKKKPSQSPNPFSTPRKVHPTAASPECDEEEEEEVFTPAATPLNSRDVAVEPSNEYKDELPRASGDAKAKRDVDDDKRGIFDRHAYDEEVFWQAYCELELHPSVPSATQDSEALSFIQKVERWFVPPSTSEQFAFWKFRMFHSHQVAQWALLIDFMIYLIVCPILLWTTIKSSGKTSPDLTLVRRAIILYTSLWMTHVVAYLLFFTLYRFRFSRIVQRMLGNVDVVLHRLWSLLQNLVVAVRVFILISEIYSQYLVFTNEDDSSYSNSVRAYCYEGHRLPMGYNSLSFPVILSAVDFLQLAVISIMPIDWICVLQITVVETIKIMLRILTCLPIEHTVIRKYIIATTITTAYCTLIVCILVTYGLESQIRTCFYHMRAQQKESFDKMQLVNMLCTDIKLPAQRLLQTFRGMEMIVPRSVGIPVKNYLEDIECHSHVLNEVIDSLLFIVKLEERRYSFEAVDTVYVASLARDAFSTAQLMLGICEDSPRKDGMLRAGFSRSLSPFMVNISQQEGSNGNKGRLGEKTRNDASKRTTKDCIVCSHRLLLHTQFLFSFLALLANLCDDDFSIWRDVLDILKRQYTEDPLGCEHFLFSVWFDRDEYEEKENEGEKFDRLLISIHASEFLLSSLQRLKRERRKQMEAFPPAQTNDQYEKGDQQKESKRDIERGRSDTETKENRAGNDGAEEEEGDVPCHEKTLSSLSRSACALSHKISSRVSCEWLITATSIFFSSRFKISTKPFGFPATDLKNNRPQIKFAEPSVFSPSAFRSPPRSRFVRSRPLPLSSPSPLMKRAPSPARADLPHRAPHFSLPLSHPAKVKNPHHRPALPTTAITHSSHDSPKNKKNNNSTNPVNDNDNDNNYPTTYHKSSNGVNRRRVLFTSNPDSYTPPLSTVLPQRAFALFSESRSESLFLNILERLPGGREISLFQEDEVFPYITSLFTLVFVQSIHGAEFVKRKGFTGAVVLVSERLAYLERESENVFFDRGIPIPCDAATLIACERWMEEYFHSISVRQAQTDQPPFNRSISFSSTADEARKKREHESRSLPESTTVDRKDGRNGGNNEKRKNFEERESEEEEEHDPLLFSPSTSSSAPSPPSFPRSRVEKQRRTEPFWRRLLMVGVQSISPSQLNSYTKWRYLNPFFSPTHHSVMIELNSLCLIAVLVSYVLLGIMTFNHAFSVTLLMLFLVLVKNIAVCSFPAYPKQTVAKDIAPPSGTFLCACSHVFGWLAQSVGRHFQRYFWMWWYLLAVIDLLFMTFTMFSDMISPRMEPVSPPPQGTPFLEFMETQYGRFVGKEIFFIFLVTPALLRTVSEYTPWPWSFFFSILRFLRAIFNMRRMFQPLLNQSMFMFIGAAMLIVNIIVLTGLPLRERIVRTGFVQLHDVILARDLRDRLLTVTRVAVSSSLSLLSQRQSVFLREVRDKCLSRRQIKQQHRQQPSGKGKGEPNGDNKTENISKNRNEHKKSDTDSTGIVPQTFFVTRALLDTLPSLEANELVLRQLAFHLKLTDPRFFARPRSFFLDKMKAHFVENLAERMGVWSSSVSDVSLQVSLRVSPSLAMVRCDEELFCAELCSLCRQARERVLEQAQRSMDFKRESHEIVILVDAWDDDADDNGKRALSLRTGKSDSVDLHTKESHAQKAVSLMKKERFHFGFFHSRSNDASPAVTRAPPRPRFTDVRTMVITVLDTSHYSPRTESSACCNSAGKLMDLVTLMDFRNNATKAMPGVENVHSLGEGFLSFFSMRGVSRAGSLAHSRYRSFQQVSIPYLLCPDSHKIKLWRDENRFSVSRLCWWRENEERRYRDSFARAIDDLLPPNGQPLSMSLAISLSSRDSVRALAPDPVDPRARLFASTEDDQKAAARKVKKNYRAALNEALALIQRPTFRRSRGKLCIFTHLNIYIAQRSALYRELFFSHGWNGFTVNNLRDWPTNAMLTGVDCILIDGMLSLPVQQKIGSKLVKTVPDRLLTKKRRNLSTNTGEISSAPGASPLSTNGTNANEVIIREEPIFETRTYTAMDLLYFLRVKGFRGVVVFIYPSPDSNASNTSKQMAQLQTWRDIESLASVHLAEAAERAQHREEPRPMALNPFAHATGPELEIYLPLDTENVQRISELCEARLLSLLLHLN